MALRLCARVWPYLLAAVALTANVAESMPLWARVRSFISLPAATWLAVLSLTLALISIWVWRTNDPVSIPIRSRRGWATGLAAASLASLLLAGMTFAPQPVQAKVIIQAEVSDATAPELRRMVDAFVSRTEGYVRITVLKEDVPLVASDEMARSLLQRNRADLVLQFFFGLRGEAPVVNVRIYSPGGREQFEYWITSEARRNEITDAVTARLLAHSVRSLEQRGAPDRSKLARDAAIRLLDGNGQNEMLGELLVARAKDREATERDRAFEDYRMAAEVGCDSPNIRREVGEYYLRQGEFDDAIREFTEVLVLRPPRQDELAVLLKRGAAYLGARNFAGAERDFRNVVEADPMSVEAHVGLGKALRALNRPAAALHHFSVALDNSPNSAAVCVERGLTYYGVLNFQLAEDDFDRALFHSPGDKIALFNRGLARLALRRYEKAIADFTATETVPGVDVDVLYHRGVANYHLGRFRVALPDFAVVITTKPDHYAAHYYLALIFTALGNFEKAQAHWEEFTRWGQPPAIPQIGFPLSKHQSLSR